MSEEAEAVVDEEGRQYEGGLPVPRNVYEAFETDPALEREGVWFDYGAIGRFKIAFHDDKGFQDAYRAEMRPFLEAHERGLLDPDIHRGILIKCYSEHLIKDWDGVKGRDDEVLPFTTENCIRVLTDLKHLFLLLQSGATRFTNYRALYAEDAAGKS